MVAAVGRSSRGSSRRTTGMAFRKVGFEPLESRHMLSLAAVVPVLVWTGAGSQTWDQTSLNWVDANGAPTAWIDGASAQFSRPGAQTIQLVNTVTVGGLSFAGGSYTISGGTIRLGAATTGISVQSQSTAQINTTIGSTGGGTSGLSAISTAQVRGLDKTGGGTLVLSGIDASVGTTTVDAGTLQLAGNQAAQNHTIIVNVNNGLTFAPGVTSPSIGGLAGSGNIVLQDASTPAPRPVTLTVGQNGESTTYNGSLSGSGGLIKAGAGTLTFGNVYVDNKYFGPTIVNGGTLVINNPLASSPVTVNSGATLAGSCVYMPAGVTVNSGGIFSPDENVHGLTITNLTLKSGSQYNFRVDRPSATSGPVQHNKTWVYWNGTVTIQPGARLNVSGNWTGNALAPGGDGDVFVLMQNYDLTAKVVGTFSNAAGALPEGTLIGINGLPFRITYTYNTTTGVRGTGHDVALIDMQPTATLSNTGPVTAGSSVTVAFSDTFDTSGRSASTNFHYSFCLAANYANLPTTYQQAGTSTKWQTTFNDMGDYTVFGRIFDPDGGYLDTSTVVHVMAATPSGSITGSAATTVGTPVTVNLQATDPSSSDLAAGLHYSFALSPGQLATTYTTAPATGHVPTTLYVAPNGSDAASGADVNHPTSLIHANRTVQPGDTVLLRGGTYPLMQLYKQLGAYPIYQSGTKGLPITYAAYPETDPNNVPVIDASEHWTWQQVTVNGVSLYEATAPSNSYITVAYPPVRVMREFDPALTAINGSQAIDMTPVAPGDVNNPHLLDDLLSPPAGLPGVTLVNGVKTVDLACDLSCYDRAAGILYYRPAHDKTFDPAFLNANLNLISGVSTLAVNGSYVTLRGLHFQNAMVGMGLGGSNDQLIGCTITDIAGQGIGLTANGNLLEGNFVDRIGGMWVKNSDGSFSRSPRVHCIYLGAGLTTPDSPPTVIQNNVIGRSFSGYSVQLYDPMTSVTNVVMDHNVIGPGSAGSIIICNGNGIELSNNVIVGQPDLVPNQVGYTTIFLLAFANDVKIHDNYIEGDDGLVLSGAVEPGSIRNIHVNDNVFNAPDLSSHRAVEFQYNDKPATLTMARNAWLNNLRFYVNVYQGAEATGMPPQVSDAGFAAFQTYGAQFGWNVGSAAQTGPLPTIDLHALDSYFGSNPSVADVWQWVRGGTDGKSNLTAVLTAAKVNLAFMKTSALASTLAPPPPPKSTATLLASTSSSKTFTFAVPGTYTIYGRIFNKDGTYVDVLKMIRVN